jgi:hypothetical protein
MFEGVVSDLEFLLQEDLLFLRKGHESIAETGEKIPASWARGLSSDSSVGDFVRRIWFPLRDHVGASLRVLVNHTLDIGLVVSPTATSPPRLLYILESETGSAFGWLAGLPATADKVSRQEMRLGVRLPQSYKLFSRVHNGFLLGGLSTVGPRSLSGLFFISLLLEADPASDRYAHLLAFSGDGGGNEQCYDLTQPTGNDEYLTVDWDHESRAVSNPTTFFAYLDRTISVRRGL